MKKDYAYYLNHVKEFGEVEEVKHPLIYLSGLPNARPMESIIFESGEVGHILSLNENTVEATTFSRFPVKIGTKATRTNSFFQVPVGEELLGKVVDAQGKIRLGTAVLSTTEFRDVEGTRATLQERAKITKPLFTGVSIIDMLLPLGEGQREMIVGDRQTGKTSVVMSIVKAQALQGTIIIYSVIGKELYEITRIRDYFEEAGILKSSVILVSAASDSPSLVDMTPYSAMTVAEYFKDQGKNVLLVLDDLTTHARYYRELALLGKRFPGRDSYPGDIFYKHARLLERAGNFIHGTGSVSITCLSISETVEESLTDYITSNLIGITDGHLLFSQDAFNRGHRPALDLFFSVTRVGRQTQQNITREFNQYLLRLLSEYEKSLKFSHFGAELSVETKKLLHTGGLINAFFEQRTGVIVPQPVQMTILGLIVSNVFEDSKTEEIGITRDTLTSLYNQDPAVQKYLLQLQSITTLELFLAEVLKNRDKLLTLCKQKK